MAVGEWFRMQSLISAEIEFLNLYKDGKMHKYAWRLSSKNNDKQYLAL
jgi:hypothetical protein